MQHEMKIDPWWAVVTIWSIVNAVNLLQAVGFVSRIRTGSLESNHMLGRVIIALAIAASWARKASSRRSVPVARIST